MSEKTASAAAMEERASALNRMWTRATSLNPPRVIRVLVFLLALTATLLACPVVAYVVLQLVLGDAFLSASYGLIRWVNGLVPDAYAFTMSRYEDLARPTVRLGVGVLSAGVIIAAFERIRATPSVLLAYFSKDTPWNKRLNILSDHLGTVLLVGVTVLVGVYALLHEPVASSGSSQARFTIPFIATGGGGASTQPIAFHVLFPEAAATLPTADPQWSFLESLMETAGACSIDADQQVRMRVTGYASTSGTNQSNLGLANARSVWLAAALDSLARVTNVGVAVAAPYVTAALHPAYPSMAAGLFPDSVGVGGAYSLPAGALNRRAEVSVLDIGACQSWGAAPMTR